MPRKWQRLQITQLTVGFGAVLVVAIVALALVASVTLRRQEIEVWRKQMANVSLLLAEQTYQSMASSYMALDSIAEEVRHSGADTEPAFRKRLASPDFFRILKEKTEFLPQVDVATIVAANGDVVNFTRSCPPPPINLADRDYFKAQSQGHGADNFISAAVRNKGNGKWVFYISRRIDDRQGNMLGLVLVGTSVDVFTSLYQRLGANLGSGASVTLYRNDYSILTRWPRNEALIGKVNTQGTTYSVVRKMKKDSGVLYLDAPRMAEGGRRVARIGAVRMVSRYPLLINVTVTDDLFLHNWRHTVKGIALITLVSIAALGFGFTLIVRMLRQRDKVLEQTKELKSRAEAASNSKSAFLANMSHEIRTPMNGIIGMAELMRETELSTEQREYMRAIKLSADNLLDIINDILDFSKIEAGRVDLEETPFFLRSMLGETLRSLASRGAQKGVEVAFSVLPEVPDPLLGDAGRLRQVLVNLVGNALKFSERGVVEVAVRLVAERDGGATLGFCVSDQGVGIPHELQARIFHAFEQGDTSTTKRFGGTGLGLAISRRLVHLMGGEISVESEPGMGSRFSFTASLKTWPEPPPETEGGEALAGVVALVVDDVAVNREMLAGFLSRWGMQVHLAGGAAEALELLAALRERGELPRLMLTDAHMPGVDGWELSQRLREEQAYDEVLIVMMPSAGVRGDVHRCRQAGIEGYLTKPVIHEELRDTLTALLKEPPDSGELPITPRRAPANQRRHTVLVVDDVEINRKIVRIILEERGHEVTEACDGQEAVDACRQSDYDIVFMDIQMPVLDGYQAIGAIRKMEQEGRRTAVVAMTAYAMKGDREKCIDAGADEYLSKPARPAEVVQILERLLPAQAQEPHRPSPEPAPGPVAEADTTPVFDHADLLARLGGEGSMVPHFIDMFTRQSAGYVEALREAVLAGDARQAAILAHTIKGAAASISAIKLYRIAASLEGVAREGRLDGAAQLLAELEAASDEFREETKGWNPAGGTRK